MRGQSLLERARKQSPEVIDHVAKALEAPERDFGVAIAFPFQQSLMPGSPPLSL